MQREIEVFNELGRGDQVLALLTEGEPDESFPAHMLARYRQAIGSDVRRNRVTLGAGLITSGALWGGRKGVDDSLDH